jgi:glutamate dehydrogenase
MAGRRQLRLFLRRDGYGRFISCLIYLPRDRFTTGNRLRMQEILLRELNGIGVDYTTRVTERMLARVHFIVRTDPADPPGTSTRTRWPSCSPTRPGCGTTTSPWCSSASWARSRPGAVRPVRQRVSGQLQGRHTPYEGMQDLAKLELLEEAGQLEMHLYRKRRPGKAASPSRTTTTCGSRSTGTASR